MMDPNDMASREAQYQQQIAEARNQDVEKVRRAQMESDREYQLKVDAAKRQKEQLAITKGQAKANEWYNRQLVAISKEKIQQDEQHFQQTFGEGQRQFNVTSSGYLDNGKPTLARDQFQDSSLRGWTGDAIKLASTPLDWVKYKRFTSGVGNSIGSIPGLSWAAGGQVGNTTAQGEHPVNSLGNVMGAMGVNVGQGAAPGAQQPASGGWASTAAQQAEHIAQTPLDLNSGEQQLYQTANEFASNPQGAAAGWYEQLDPMTRDLLQGAAEAQGHDWGTVMSRYKRSRWGGGGSAVAA